MVVAVYIKGFLYTDIFIANGYWATIDILVNHFTMNGHAKESYWISHHTCKSDPGLWWCYLCRSWGGPGGWGRSWTGMSQISSLLWNDQHCPGTGTVLTLMAEMILQGATISVWPQLLDSIPNPSRSRFRYWRPVKCWQQSKCTDQ